MKKWALLPLFFLLGCSNDVEFQVGETSQEFAQDVKYNRTVDILFVIDNGSSMNLVQQQLHDQLPYLFDSKLDSSETLFFADATTSFFVVTNRRANAGLSLIVDRDQVLKILVQDSSVRLVHEAPANSYSETSFTIDPNQPIVVAARAGKDPKNILLMVNGEYRELNVKQTGTPVNFSYLESSLSLKNVQETIIFNRTMEPGEINVISRQIASLYGIPTRTSANTPDYLAWSNESPLFSQVRNIMKNSCFRCHTSWISLSESGFTTASSYTKNIQLVKPKSLAESPFWHSLKGSSDNNTAAKRDMPKDLPALSSEQLSIIKDWILNLP